MKHLNKSNTHQNLHLVIAIWPNCKYDDNFSSCLKKVKTVF